MGDDKTVLTDEQVADDYSIISFRGLPRPEINHVKRAAFLAGCAHKEAALAALKAELENARSRYLEESVAAGNYKEEIARLEAQLAEAGILIADMLNEDPGLLEQTKRMAKEFLKAARQAKEST